MIPEPLVSLAHWARVSLVRLFTAMGTHESRQERLERTKADLQTLLIDAHVLCRRDDRRRREFTAWENRVWAARGGQEAWLEFIATNGGSQPYFFAR